MRLITFLSLLLLSSFSLTAHAGEAPLISDGWVRAVPPGAPNSAAYMTISNHQENSLTLVSATSNISKMVQLHLSKMEDGVMKMEHQKEGIEVPASGTLELKPGSFHVMFMGLKQPLKAGDQVELVLQFSNGASQTLQLPVAAPTENMHHSKHEEMKH